MSGTEFEYWTARVPSWVVPAPMAVRDMTLLAAHLYRDKPNDAIHGVTAALAWILGDAYGPITGRTEQPVTRNLAQAEETASAIAFGPIFDLGSDYARLGVANVPARPHSTSYCRTVSRTLWWLRGKEDIKPPMTVPVRDDHGRPLTARELYDRRVAADPLARLRVAEENEALYIRCEQDASRYRALAQLIDASDRH
ncbi:MAG: hypothetical protein JO296_16510 [Pseudonocardiales bacterium]|nr:hypothetical protein [Pseudonocardiales bacterium]